jgi:hypothetical protein
MWDRLSPAARRVMSLASEEPEQFCDGYLGDEHVILGLLRGSRATRRPCCADTAWILRVPEPSCNGFPRAG